MISSRHPAESIARTLSAVFYPFPVAIGTLFVAIGLTESSWELAVSWTAVSVLTVIVPLGAVIFYKLQVGQYEDWDVSIRESRHLLYTIALVCFGILMGIYFVWQAPAVAFICAYSAIPTLGVAMLINRKWTKISLHATTLAGCTTLFLFISPLGALVLFICGLVTGWSRVYLGKHTPQQILLGWLVGGLFIGVITNLIGL